MCLPCISRPNTQNMDSLLRRLRRNQIPHCTYNHPNRDRDSLHQTTYSVNLPDNLNKLLHRTWSYIGQIENKSCYTSCYPQCSNLRDYIVDIQPWWCPFAKYNMNIREYTNTPRKTCLLLAKRWPHHTECTQQHLPPRSTCSRHNPCRHHSQCSTCTGQKYTIYRHRRLDRYTPCYTCKFHQIVLHFRMHRHHSQRSSCTCQERTLCRHRRLDRYTPCCTCKLRQLVLNLWEHIHRLI